MLKPKSNLEVKCLQRYEVQNQYNPLILLFLRILLFNLSLYIQFILMILLY